MSGNDTDDYAIAALSGNYPSKHWKFTFIAVCWLTIFP